MLSQFGSGSYQSDLYQREASWKDWRTIGWLERNPDHEQVDVQKGSLSFDQTCRHAASQPDCLRKLQAP
jgi:hypothetical protein